MGNKRFIAIPPGVSIKEQLLNMGMSQSEFAAKMKMSEIQAHNLLNGDVRLTTEVASRLESVLGVPASFWLNLESIYREKLLKAESESNN